MSGGSYDYLCHVTDLEDLLGKQAELGQMADRLEGLDEAEFPGATAAGRLTRELLLMTRLWESHTAASIELLGEVWHDVEWWDSSDYGPDEVREGLGKLLRRASPRPMPPCLCGRAVDHRLHTEAQTTAEHHAYEPGPE